MISGENEQHPAAKPFFNLSPRRSAALGYFGSTIVFGLVSAALGPTLPMLAEHVNTGLSQISLIFTAQATGYLLGSFFGGRLFDRLPGNRLLSLVLGCMAVLTFLIPVVSFYWLLIAIFLLVGTMMGSMEVGVNTLLVWLMGKRVGPYMNALHFFFGVGAFISPLIVARALAASWEIRWVYWLLALTAIPVAIWLGRLSGPKAPAGAANSRISHANYLLVTLLSILLFLYVAAEVSYGGWVFTYTVGQFGTGVEATAAILTSAYWGALTFGRLVSIPLAVRIKPSMFLISDLIGCLLSIGLVAAYPNSMTALWVGTLGLGFSMAAFFPTTVTYAGQRMQLNAKISGWLFVGAGAGGMVLPWLIGQLFEVSGPDVVITLIFADLLIALGVLAVVLLLPVRATQPVAQAADGD
jgi:FHS family Na+ dependent glucose MFS transporter 1